MAGETVPFRFGDEFYDVPVENAQAAVERGWHPASEEEVKRYDSLQEYKGSRSETEQAIDALATGSVSAALSVPALISNIIPGVDGQSGNKWLAGITSLTSGRSVEELESELRTMAEASPVAGFTGQVIGSLAGSGMAGAVAKGLASKATGIAAKALASPAAPIASNVADNVLASISMANEEAFVRDSELTTELMLAAAAYGGFTPLAFKGVTAGSRKLGSKLAGKYDAGRMARYQSKADDIESFNANNFRPQNPAAPATEEGFDFAAKQAADLAEMDGISGQMDQFLNVHRANASRLMEGGGSSKLTDEINSFLRKADKQGAAYGGYVYRGVSPAELSALEKGLVNNKIWSVSREMDGALPFAKKNNGVLLEIESGSGAVPVDAMSGSNTFREALIAQGEKWAIKGERNVDGVRVIQLARDRKLGPNLPMPQKPALLAGLFGSREQVYDALANIAEGVASGSSKAAHAVRGRVKMGAEAEVRRFLNQAMGMQYVRNYAASGGNKAARFAVDALISPMAGSFAARVAEKYGGPAAGMLFNGLAKSMRSMAKNVRVASRKAPPMFSPLGVGVSALSRAAWNARVESTFDLVQNDVASVMADREGFVNRMGETFGGFEYAEPGTVSKATQKYSLGLSHLVEKMPKSAELYPGFPGYALGRPSVGEQESFIRRYIAVNNPLVLLDELERGDVNQETVEAVAAAYPTMFLDMLSEVSAGLNNGEPLSRRQEMALSTFFAGHGVPFGAQAPRYMAQLHQIQSELQVQHKGPAGQSKPGAKMGSPTLAQSIKTGSQSSTDSIYN